MTIHDFHSKEKYSIEWLCRLLKVFRAAYYQWLNRKPSQRELENEQLFKLIRDAHSQLKGLFGSYQMYHFIKNKVTFSVNPKRIERLMGIHNLHFV